MLVLGINCAYHESAAAVVRDGRLVAAVEEERFSRRKRGKAALVGNADEVPQRAIAWALGAAGARPGDVDAVAVGFAPRARLAMRWADPPPLADPEGWGTPAGERAFEAALGRIPARLAELGVEAPVRFVPHHRAHAASAFYPSGFERAAALVIDGIGEHQTMWLGRGAGARLWPIARARYPHSIGLVWERVAVHLGFTEHDAPKVMGLAAYGDPARFREAVARVLRVDPAGDVVVDLELARFRAADTASLTPLFGPPKRADEPHDAPRLADVAAALQAATEEAVLAIARRLWRATGERRLAYAGGVALNCVANARLEREGPFDEVYIPAAAHDAGTAVGAAMVVARWAGRGASTSTSASANGRLPATPFLGPSYSHAEARAALEAAGLDAVVCADPAGEAASLVAAGAIVGWFQGALELGPRALGHRSLLADPRRASIREELNRRVKHREPFRPFAAAVLDDALPAWFDVPARAPRGPSRDLMLFAYPVRAEHRAAIPAVVHRDGTCRVQAVARERDPRFHALVARFRDLTGIPLVLNTSFNDSEPIVCSPTDAIRTFLASGIDALFLGDLRAVRRA